jgi:tetratricopeptide (TPR) repeat protein
MRPLFGAKRPLEQLTRLAAKVEAGEHWIQGVLDRDFARFADIALEVAVEQDAGHILGHLLAGKFRSDPALELAERLFDTIGGSVNIPAAWCEVALEVTRQSLELREAALREDASTETQRQAVHRRIFLGVCLHALGRYDEALEATLEVCQWLRDLAAAKPAIFEADLARSLTHVSVRFSYLNRREEALEAIQEAVALERRLSRQAPRSALASSLDDLSIILHTHDRPTEALEASREAVRLRQILADRDPAMRPSLAGSLTNLAGRLDDLKRYEEARAVLEDAVRLRRALARDEPNRFRADLARSLHNLSLVLGKIDRPMALARAQEAVTIRRQLADRQPGIFDANLAKSLSALGACLMEAGRKVEACEAHREAVALRRALVLRQPDPFRESLADSQHELGTTLNALGRSQEALPILQEALALRKNLLSAPSRWAFTDLAETTCQLATILHRLRRSQEAVEVIEDSFRRLLAADRRHRRRLQQPLSELVVSYRMIKTAATIRSDAVLVAQVEAALGSFAETAGAEG